MTAEYKLLAYSVVVQFGSLDLFQRRHPETRRTSAGWEPTLSEAEGDLVWSFPSPLPGACRILRCLKNGCAQDDAYGNGNCRNSNCTTTAYSLADTKIVLG